MKILLATTNRHKVDEIRAIWSDLAGSSGAVPVALISLDDLAPSIPEPVEDQPTFEANAILKARHYARLTGMLCLADDSGLEVDALAGDPGVRSARYAGVSGPRQAVDRANNRLLLEKLANTPAAQRTARFVCAMALCAPPPEVPSGIGSHKVAGDMTPDATVVVVKTLAIVRGTIEGRIIGPNEPARGDNGFGYDPLFVVPTLGRTTAELTPDQKNAISHRGDAARRMWRRIHELAAAKG